MEYFLSDNYSTQTADEVGDLLRMAQDPTVISLSAGSPATEALPFEKIETWAKQALITTPAKALQYSASEGDGDLLWLVRHKLIEENLFRSGEKILITNGAQQGLEFAAKCLCNKGDTVLCENPTFMGALNAFESNGVQVKGVPMEQDGLNLEALEQLLKTQKNVRFLYVIPNFQNPTGITTSFEKRREILKLAQEYNILILEDNPYGALRFEGEEQPSIKSFDEEGRVIYLGSFSKILSPGLRMGFMVAAAQFFHAFVKAKLNADVHTSGLSQQICKQFLKETDLSEHYQALSAIYEDKCTCMVNAMKEHFGENFEFIKPQGGLFIWCKLPKEINATDFAKLAIGKHKVAIVPGSVFAVEKGSVNNFFRLNYSVPSKEQIELAIAALGQLYNEMKNQ